jgi:hypothetical protein
MNLSANDVQVTDGRAYFNIAEGFHGVEVSSCTTSRVITAHLIAWGKSHGGSAYTVISVETAHLPYWLERNRNKYGKILEIVAGGVENMPPMP